MSKLTNLLETYTRKYEVRDDFIRIACKIGNVQTDIKVYIEPTDFQINLGDFVTLDKIENQKIEFDDIEDLISDFLKSITNNKVSLLEHNLFGLKAYSIDINQPEEISHTHYETPTHALLKKLGKTKAVGIVHLI